MQFIVKLISKNATKTEIEKIGFDPSYLDFGVKKHEFLNLKIFSLKPAQANILKQTALTVGCDCATNKHVIDCKAESSDCVLSGSFAQLKSIAFALKKQAFSLAKLSNAILEQIVYFSDDKPQEPLIMGILNLTADSFSDGGEYLDFNRAINHTAKMVEDGANIIDIGAESTRPSAKLTGPVLQLKMLLPVIKEIKKIFPQILLSVDTRSSVVAKDVISAGVEIINDVSGLNFDLEMAPLLAKKDVKVVITHSRGTPETMDKMCNYENLIDDIYLDLYAMTQSAISFGIKPENIIIDPGFGFAKNREQNFELLKRVGEFKSLGYPILAGVSRKRFLCHAIKTTNPTEADDVSAYAAGFMAQSGVDILRVHDTKKTADVLQIAKRLF